MAITIINPETETAIQRLATLTGQDPSRAVHTAVEAALVKARHTPSWEFRMARVRAKLAAAANDPIMSPEAVGKPFYDDLWDQ